MISQLLIVWPSLPPMAVAVAIKSEFACPGCWRRMLLSPKWPSGRPPSTQQYPGGCLIPHLKRVARKSDFS
jgi:hypothetical protein